MSTEFGRLLAEVMRSMQSGTPKEQLEATMNIYGYHMKLKASIAELEAEIEDLKPYKHGYSTLKDPKYHEWVIVDYKDHLYFGYFDHDREWTTQYRDNIREGVTRWYPLPILPEDANDEPA